MIVDAYTELEQLAQAMPRGPYFPADWSIGPRSFEVGSECEGRPRIASDMVAGVANYFAALSPEVVLQLIAQARKAQQVKA